MKIRADTQLIKTKITIYETLNINHFYYDGFLFFQWDFCPEH